VNGAALALIFSITAAPPALDLDENKLTSIREKTIARRARPKPFDVSPQIIKTPRFLFVRDNTLSLPSAPWVSEDAYAAAFELARSAWDGVAAQPDRARILLVFSTFDDGGDALFYLAMANDVRGLGSGTPAKIFDDTPGSQLDGFAWLGDVDRLKEAGDEYFREAFIHEIAHRWSAYGDPEMLRGRQSMHWSFFANVGTSPMEGNSWIDEGGGEYSTSFESPPKLAFHPLDLYFMGLLAPEEVPPLFVLDEVTLLSPSGAQVSSVAPPAHRQQKQIRVHAELRREVRIEDVIRESGRREPPATNEHVVWPIGIVLLSNGLGNTKIEELAELDRRIAEYAQDFLAATGGRMSLELAVEGAGTRTLGERCDALDDCDRTLADRCDGICIKSCIECRADGGTSLLRPDGGEDFGATGSLTDQTRRGCGCEQTSSRGDLFFGTAVLLAGWLTLRLRTRKSSRVW
jgi:hypothetical protein